jgi:hypothetical protein
MAELWALNMRGKTWLGSSMRKTVRATAINFRFYNGGIGACQWTQLSLSIFLISVICVVASRNLTTVSLLQLLSLLFANHTPSLEWVVVLNRDRNPSSTCQSEPVRGAIEKRQEIDKREPRRHPDSNVLHEVRLWGIAIWSTPINEQPCP